ncbi:hypothetical protein J1605_015416 [Eschrichtius robustus]|uniref:Transmembrane and TPR repeat-containing protein 2 n=1 Tax=Eschrichtius robustus TaxID=9764 RepID=A0AB34G9Z3_ESCRO|nr:hypothetical protein J1605_015416 [Eschrichtius robustus]
MGNFYKGLSFLASFQFALYHLQNRAFLYHPQNWASTYSQQDRGRIVHPQESASVLFTFAVGLLLQENSRFAEALHYYKLAIGSRPTLASAYLNTGIILMNQGKTEEARRTFLKCSEIPDENLKDPHAHKSSVTSCLYNLGKLYHEQGHYEDALSVYKEAIQKMPRQFAPQSLYNMMGK